MLQLSRMPSGQPEVFASIQGEGVSAGVPSVFLRLAVCNLHCVWCDTKYTWDWDRYDPHQEIVTLACSEVARLVQAKGPRNVVITGGEPLLQQRELGPLALELKAAGLRLEVETNGTIAPDGSLATAIDQWNVSPKLASSANGFAERECAAALLWFAAHPSAYVKFVIVDAEDVEEALDLAARYDIPRDRVILMPEGADPATLQRRSSWLVEECQRVGVRYGPRLHILLWGDQRGR